MPFTKITSGKHKGNYSSPSGRMFTKKQVEAYYATDGFSHPVTHSKARRMADHAVEPHRAKMGDAIEHTKRVHG